MTPPDCMTCGGTRRVRPHDLQEARAGRCPNPVRRAHAGGPRLSGRVCGCAYVRCSKCPRPPAAAVHGKLERPFIRSAHVHLPPKDGFPSPGADLPTYILGAPAVVLPYPEPGAFPLPVGLQNGLLRYVDEHRTPGGFLLAALEGRRWDQVVAKADALSMASLRTLQQVIFNFVTGVAWGTVAKVERWIADAETCPCRTQPIDHWEPGAGEYFPDVAGRW